MQLPYKQQLNSYQNSGGTYMPIRLLAGLRKYWNTGGRYTHKTAITAHRIKLITHTTISFAYKDYADGKKQKLMTLSHEEFLRRFEQHILPARFVRIRHGGYLSHNGKNSRIAAVLLQLKLPKPMPKVIIPFSLQMLQRTGTAKDNNSRCDSLTNNNRAAIKNQMERTC